MKTKCNHKYLTLFEPEITVVKISLDVKPPNVPVKVEEYFMYKRYVCKDCGKTVLILQGIVES